MEMGMIRRKDVIVEYMNINKSIKLSQIIVI